MHDIVIIGGGPAGMTASVYAARKVLDQVFISPDIGGQAAWASEIENYLGYSYISGFELVTKFEEHVKNFGVDRVDDKVRSLVREDGGFLTTTEGGREFQSRTVIVASGRYARNLGVPGEEQYTGRGISYCATCDAPLFAGEKVAVVGGGNAGVDAAVQLDKIADRVHLIEADPKLSADAKYQQRIRGSEKIEVRTSTEVVGIRGNKFLEGIAVQDTATKREEEIEVAGLFVEIGTLPNVGFLPPEVRVNRRREIMIDCSNYTNIPGLFAAGDVTNIPNKQIIIAAGEGAKALLSAQEFLISSQ